MKTVEMKSEHWASVLDWLRVMRQEDCEAFQHTDFHAPSYLPLKERIARMGEVIGQMEAQLNV